MEESNLTQAIRHLGAGKTNDDLHEFFPILDVVMQSLQYENIKCWRMQVPTKMPKQSFW